MSINLENLYANACENLKNVCRLLWEDGDEADAKYRLYTADPNTWLNVHYQSAVTPALEIWNAAHEELYRSKGGSAYSALKRIVKNASDNRPDIKGAWLDSDGRQCVCDGYRAVRLNAPVGGLPEVKGMELSNIIPQNPYPLTLTLPTPGELKACIAEQKGRGRKFYDFGEDRPRVNAQYLKDMMDIFPDATVTWSGLNCPLLFHSDVGNGILLPVHKYPAA